MFGESVFLVKCCGFNWQLSHSHANNQPYTLQRNFAQTQPVTAPLESYLAWLKNFAAELFIKIVLSITSLNRAVQCRGDYLKFPNIWWYFIALRLMYPSLLPVLTVAPRRVEFKLVKWCPCSQIDTIDDTLSDIFKDDQNMGRQRERKRKKERDLISHPEKS